ncbi:GTP-binding protein, partial [Campylobacter coli]|nr:GTP-binding protein [Campylobacter coli]ELR8457890.1 GTP-binding protein [Campylobacter coli]ELS4964770.1 GTP-binding protein [Campylobacter coli]ELV9544959.1 GTP-binding protein [Campylobacter coli]
MAKIPVHVVTGFLGSGKTTFLKEILTNQALNDIALVINELGEVSLDREPHLLI